MSELFTFEGFKIEDIEHHGVRGQHWGLRRYQNPDGSLTPLGRQRLNRQQTHAAQKAEKIKNKELKRRNKEKEFKQKIIRTGDVDALYRNRDKFSKEEVNAFLEHRKLLDQVKKTAYNEKVEAEANKAQRKLDKELFDLQKKAAKEAFASQRKLEKESNKNSKSQNQGQPQNQQNNQNQQNQQSQQNKQNQARPNISKESIKQARIDKKKEKLLKEGDPDKIKKNLSLFSQNELREYYDKQKTIESIRSNETASTGLNDQLTRFSTVANSVAGGFNAAANVVGSVTNVYTSYRKAMAEFKGRKNAAALAAVPFEEVINNPSKFTDAQLERMAKRSKNLGDIGVNIGRMGKVSSKASSPKEPS